MVSSSCSSAQWCQQLQSSRSLDGLTTIPRAVAHKGLAAFALGAKLQALPPAAGGAGSLAVQRAGLDEGVSRKNSHSPSMLLCIIAIGIPTEVTNYSAPSSIHRPAAGWTGGPPSLSAPSHACGTAPACV
jgi:hypothetical protein